MSNAYIVGQRAAKIEDLQVTFAKIDARRWAWAAERFAALDAPAAAERAREFAAEYEALAERIAARVGYGVAEGARVSA